MAERLVVGSVWSNREALKNAALDYARKEAFEFKTKFADARRWTIVCRGKNSRDGTDCSWRLHAAVPKEKKGYTLRNIKETHICDGILTDKKEINAQLHMLIKL